VLSFLTISLCHISKPFGILTARSVYTQISARYVTTSEARPWLGRYMHAVDLRWSNRSTFCFSWSLWLGSAPLLIYDQHSISNETRCLRCWLRLLSSYQLTRSIYWFVCMIVQIDSIRFDRRTSTPYKHGVLCIDTCTIFVIIYNQYSQLVQLCNHVGYIALFEFGRQETYIYIYIYIYISGNEAPVVFDKFFISMP